MGTRNWQLIRDLKVAQQAGKTDEVSRLLALVEESQAGCIHSDSEKHVVDAPEDIQTPDRGLIPKGDQVFMCFGCSRVLRHYPRRS